MLLNRSEKIPYVQGKQYIYIYIYIYKGRREIHYFQHNHVLLNELSKDTTFTFTFTPFSSDCK